MKKIVIFTTLIIALLLSGCSNEELFDKQSIDKQDTGSIEGNTVTMVATMPGESLKSTKTRIALDQIGMNVALTWEPGDELQVCIVYGPEGAKEQLLEVVEVAINPDDAKSASFSFSIPDDITEFDIYGIYGGNGLSTVDGEENWAILPTSSQYLGGSLKDLQDSEAVMLTFQKEIDLNDAELDLSVGFEHLGTLFSFQVNNNSANDWEGVKKVELRSTSTATIGAHVNTGSARYNIITGEFEGTESLTALPFELQTSTTIKAGESVEFWGWYPPVSGVNWPEMTLAVTDVTGTSWETDASESKPARTSPTEAGKTFYFATYFDGTTLSFEDSQADIIFVRPNTTGSGTSWSDATGDIQAAINKAGKEVWIQGGTYKLTSPILAKANVNVYGSFAGNETSIDDRALTTGGNPWDFVSPTVLDGQNQTRVLEIRVASTVDGLTIINGNGASTYQNGRGGGVDMVNANAVVQNCIIRDNSSTLNGGGIHIYPAGIVRRSLIENNSTPIETTSARGGGIYINNGKDPETIIEKCIIRGNSSHQGGGIRGQGNGGNIKLLKNRIYSNTSSSSGAALSLTAGWNIVINNLVYNNESTTNGAASVIAGGKVINNSFVNNIGHVLFSIDTNPYEFINNIDFGNTAVVFGADSNENLQFYNNATGLSQSAIETRSWQYGDNVSLNSSDIIFKEITSFVGAATDEAQKSELENIDFSLVSTSPALDTGKTVSDVTDDIVGTSRPQGGAYDIGAYELE